MKKIFCVLSIILSGYCLTGTEIISINPQVVPGSKAVAPLRQKVRLSGEFAKAGTVILRLKPENWDYREQKWHFFVRAGEMVKSQPHIWLYKFPDGQLRLLWNKSKKEVGDVYSSTAAPFNNKKWIHIAFRWQCRKKGTEIALFVNGVKQGSRWIASWQIPASEFPADWLIGDEQLWNPRSKGITRLGWSQFIPRALSDTEINADAMQKFTPDGKGKKIIIRNFIPGQAGEIEIKNGLPDQFSLTARNEMGLHSPLPLQINCMQKSFKLKFQVPDDAVELVLSGAPANFELQKIHNPPWRPAKDICFWQGAWIWGDNDYRPDARCFFRRKFTVKNYYDLVKAAFQWATDEHSEIYLNGKFIGAVSSWANPQVRENLLQIIHPGENILAIEASNGAGDAGFLGELSLIDRNGKVSTVASDSKFRFTTSKPQEGWQNLNYPDSTWRPVQIKCYPPQNPYGATPYKYYGKYFRVGHAESSFPAAVNPGQRFSIKSGCQVEPELPDDPVKLGIFYRNSELAAFPVKIQRTSNRLQWQLDLTFPPAFSGKELELRPLSSRIKFEPLGKIKVKTSKLLPVTAQVKRISGAPRLVVNDQIKTPMFYRTPLNPQKRTDSYHFMRSMSQQGNIEYYEISLCLADYWQAENQFNWDKLEKNILAPLLYAPRSKLIVWFNMDAPKWFLRKYPEERCQFDSGQYADEVSYASVRYRHSSALALQKIVSFITTLPLYGSIIGFGMDGGEDGQFMQWTGRNLQNLSDYSVPMRCAFQKQLAARYHNIANLNTKHQTHYRSFAEIPLPSRSQRTRCSPLLYDPQTEWSILEYNQCFSQVVVDTILTYAGTLKSATRNQRIVGIYYGKCFSVAGFNEWGEFGLGQLLKSPFLDYFVGVEYAERSPGRPHSVSAPLASLNLHNKIFIDEGDLRTFLGGTKTWGYTGNMADTIALIRKMFIFTQVKGHGIHWYDLHGGAFEHPAILNAIKTVKTIADRHTAMPVNPGEIACFFDENSMSGTSAAIKNLMRHSVLHQQNGKLNQIGADIDFYLQSELLNPKLPPYKMYIFLNSFTITPEQQKTINALKKDHALLVFLWNSGWSNGRTGSGNNIEKITQIPVYPLAAGTSLCMRGKYSGQYASSCGAEPAFAPNAKTGTVLAELVPSGQPAAVLMDFSTWRSFYSVVPVLSPGMWRRLAKIAGVHLYSERPQIIVYPGSELCGIHAILPGEKKIRFPKAYRYFDAVTGQGLGQGNTLNLNWNFNETQIVELKKL